ncbi:uncharacterized protein LOC120655267 isoform X2 [Panicum virgatum]|uniref:uncharacterized protein LOC120655267 isoform X2 n=1 Tax=Panicum virgatum TaxID=38727 RepID=UPI0019D5B512|nr:uncharacterized protein LOC120655267 isoform X2 [Panicum virgatum]
MARRGCPSSPAPAPPLDNDDILSEILLRLPPAPSSLPRASLVCTHWRRLVTNPAFLRRFRTRHRRAAPLLGFFTEGLRGLLFTPTLEPPNRVPRGCFTLQLDDVGEWRILSCRHGLVLLLHLLQLQVLVWDPVTGDQRRIAVPRNFRTGEGTIINNGAVLRAAGDVHGGSQSSTFQVVLVGNNQGFTRPLVTFVCVYSSENGEWRDPISIACPLTSVTRYIPGWVLGKTIQLDNLLPLSSTEASYPRIYGFAEDDKVFLIRTTDRIFTIQLESMKFVQFKICSAILYSSIFYPFSSVYTTGMGLGDGHEGAELLFNA